jgi:hypothetical protein
MDDPLKIQNIPLKPKGCRWFVKRSATTWFNRGFRSKSDASNWINGHGPALDWRSGFVFRLKGCDEDIEIVDRTGKRAT